MAYDRITSLPDDIRPSEELRALKLIWDEKRHELERSRAFGDFLKRLQREWAIETGIIERLYSWDRGVTEILIEHGIEAAVIAHQGGVTRERAQEISALISDQLNVIESLFSFVKGDRPLTEHFIKSLHSQFTANQETTDALAANGRLVRVPLLRGEYKKQPNNPKRPDGSIHFYCPPEFVQDEMERLVGWYADIADRAPAELTSAWLHHRFTQIHPFQDGNGRIARALASIVFLRAGSFPLVIREVDRDLYIRALEQADQGQLQPLVDLFARRQRDSILRALNLQEQAVQASHAEQVIASALELLKTKKAAVSTQIRGLYKFAGELFSEVATELQRVAQRLDKDLPALSPTPKDKFAATMQKGEPGSDTAHYFREEIIDLAKRFDYRANFEQFQGWAKLAIRTRQQFELVIAIHGLGAGETGILVMSAFTHLRVPREGGGTQPVDMRPACVDCFQFNYAEDRQSVQDRLKDWLAATLAIGLAEWKRTLE